MIYSHFYDLLVKLLLFALIVAVLLIMPIEYWQHLMIVHWGLKAAQAQFIIVFLICVLLIAPLFLLGYLSFLSPFAAWCYLRFSLKTPVSWLVAKKVESLFRPTLARFHRWYPMTMLKSIPPQEREAELLHFFNQVRSHKEEKILLDRLLYERLSPNGYRAYNILLVLMALWLIYGMFDQSGLPGLLMRFQAEYLFHGRYYPLLSFILAFVLCMVLLAGLFLFCSQLLKRKV